MDIQLPQIIFYIINFTVVFVGVSYLLSKPIQKILSERSEKIVEGQKAATIAIEEKEKLASFKKQSQKDTDKEVAGIISKAQQQADEQSKAIISEAKAQAKKDIEKMQADWEKEKQVKMKQAHKEMASAIVDVSEKVIAQKLTGKSDSDLIDKELDSLISGM